MPSRTLFWGGIGHFLSKLIISQSSPFVLLLTVNGGDLPSFVSALGIDEVRS